MSKNNSSKGLTVANAVYSADPNDGKCVQNCE